MTDIPVIYPGTTPTLTFEFPDDIVPSTCQHILLLLSQGNRVIVQKENWASGTSGNQLTVSGQNVSVTLTQLETLSFAPFPTIGLELWVKTSTGSVPDPWTTSLPIGRVKSKRMV